MQTRALELGAGLGGATWGTLPPIFQFLSVLFCSFCSAGEISTGSPSWDSNQQEHAYDAHVVLDSSVVPCFD